MAVRNRVRNAVEYLYRNRNRNRNRNRPQPQLWTAMPSKANLLFDRNTNRNADRNSKPQRVRSRETKIIYRH